MDTSGKPPLWKYASSFEWKKNEIKKIKDTLRIKKESSDKVTDYNNNLPRILHWEEKNTCKHHKKG